MKDAEIWKDIRGYEGIYRVSTYGNVYSVRSKKMLKHLISTSGCSLGRHSVALSVGGKIKRCLVHRLVAEAFIENLLDLSQVNHKDEDPSNNHMENLEWCDAKYNHNYGTAIARRSATNRSNSKTIIQRSLSGSFIKEHDCLRSVEELGFKRPHVIDCCKGRIPTSQGFIWEYGGGS